jgi:DNA-binding response OmpR family regulator
MTAHGGVREHTDPLDLYPADVAQVLVVEDDETIGSVLVSSLESQGHDVVWERTGHGALTQAVRNEYALVLLDLGLPDLDGIQVCRCLRLMQPFTVLVMLTARTEEMDVVLGLEAGADDYLTKPVRLGELLARVRAHLRRAHPADPGTGPASVGDLVIDPVSRRVTVAGRELSMRTKEFDLLVRLAATPGAAVSRKALMAEVWDENWYGSTKTLDVHVATLRRRLASVADHAAVPRIVTLRGHGYRLEPPE